MISKKSHFPYKVIKRKRGQKRVFSSICSQGARTLKLRFCRAFCMPARKKWVPVPKNWLSHTLVETLSQLSKYFLHAFVLNAWGSISFKPFELGMVAAVTKSAKLRSDMTNLLQLLVAISRNKLKLC